MANEEKKPVEKVKTESVSTETSAVQATTEAKVETAKFYTKPVFVLFTILAVLGLGAVSAFILTQVLESNKKDNALGEVTTYSQDVLTTMVDSMNFKALEEGDDDEFIDFEQLMEDLEETAEFKYLSAPDIDLAGNTSHTAMDGSFDMGDEGKFSFNFDIYTEYPEDYEATELETIEDVADLSDDEIEELIPLTYITGEFSLDSEEYVFESDVNLTLDGFEGYLELSNVNVEGDDVTEDVEEGFNMLEDKVVKLDATDFMVEFFGSYSDMLENYGSNYGMGTIPTDPDAIIETYEGYIQMMLGSLTEEDREIAGRIGPKIQSELKQMINNYDLFTSISTVDPIREKGNSKCVEGRVDFNNLINTTEDGILDMAQVIVNDKDYDGDDFETISDEVTEGFDDARDWVADQDLKVFVTTCSDRDENYTTGMGFAMHMEDYDSGTPLDLELNYFVVDYTSDFEIEIPEEDMDYTDEFNEYVEESGILEMMSGETTIDDIYDGGEVDYNDGWDVDTDDSTDYSDPYSDAYWEEWDVIFDQWLNGEITDEEYDELMNDLNEKYNY